MAFTITPEIKMKLENQANQAEPYSDEEIDGQLDGTYDIERFKATIAKELLDGTYDRAQQKFDELHKNNTHSNTI